MELIRLYQPEWDFTLQDLWTFGSPRVGPNAFAIKVKEVLQASNPVRNHWRITRNGDGVPTVPNIPYFIPGTGWIAYKHLDIGYKLTPGQDTKVTERPTEIDESIQNDLGTAYDSLQLQRLIFPSAHRFLLLSLAPYVLRGCESGPRKVQTNLGSRFQWIK